MIKDIWCVLTGRLNWEHTSYLEWTLHKAEVQLAQVEQLKHDLGLAKATIAELKSQLPTDYEAKRKVASDEIGNKLIADMKAHPEKYIGG